jgi:hypothetical protein
MVFLMLCAAELSLQYQGLLICVNILSHNNGKVIYSEHTIDYMFQHVEHICEFLQWHLSKSRQ